MGIWTGNGPAQVGRHAGKTPSTGTSMLTCTYEKSSACRGLWGRENGYEKAPTGGAIGRWCASWWFFGLGEALYGSGLVGPLELIAELFGYMLKRLDITSDLHDVDEVSAPSFAPSSKGFTSRSRVEYGLPTRRQCFWHQDRFLKQDHERQK